MTDTEKSFMESLDPESLLFGHTDEASALVVEDYPYGFRLRTSIRYWIETTKNGDRFVSQTLNPKVAGEHWNKPKKSTYSVAGVMFREADTGHIKWTGISHYSSDEVIAQFYRLTVGKLSEAQTKALAKLMAIRKGMEGVTFTVRERGTAAEEAEADKEQVLINRFLNRRIARQIPVSEKTVALGNELAKVD